MADTAKNFEPSNPKDFSEFIQISDATKQENQLWTVHCEGFGKPGKIYNCVGSNEYEAKEDAWVYLITLKAELDKNKCITEN